MICNTLLQLASGPATAELKTLLEDFRKNNGDDKYNQLVTALDNSFLLLKGVVGKSKIGTTLVNIILNALPV